MVTESIILLIKVFYLYLHLKSYNQVIDDIKPWPLITKFRSALWYYVADAEQLSPVHRYYYISSSWIDRHPVLCGGIVLVDPLR